MTQQTINIGTAANDGTGDPLRTAFTKVNENFGDLYDGKADKASPVFTGVVHVTGVARVDGLRIDQSPTSETVVCTHTITINLNGTDYKIPCVAA